MEPKDLPPPSDFRAVAAAYDTVAIEYDGHMKRDAWNRRVLWRHFRRLFRAGDRVLDAGCGTGTDALHLASRGVHVTAIDVSPGMLERLRAKLGSAPEETRARVDVQLGDLATVIASLDAPFDGIVSSFAALNTVDLSRFGRESARLLRPGGHLLCHMLSPGYLRPAPGRSGGRGSDGGGSPRSAFADEPTLGDALGASVRVNGRPVPHLLLDPAEIYARFFATGFVCRRAHALGFLVRPSLETRLPSSWLDALGALESVVGAWPGMTARGRYFFLELERRSA